VDDPRITKVGSFLRRSRLDEIPQLINILKGDMSLVGPRPERPEFVGELKKMIPYYSERHYVKPGLTGWAQVLYPYGSSVEDAIEKLRYDMYYIKNISIILDLYIVLKTIKVVLLGKGR
jgi:lipopolysaccharide/colanic/teichoic acid biosynthesis glycosyltransferase